MRTPAMYLSICLVAAAAGALLLWPRWASHRTALDATVTASSGASAGSAQASSSGSTAVPEMPAGASASALLTPTAAPAEAAPDGALCPADMRYVEANYCPFVAHRCAVYVGAATSSRRRNRKRRCQTYRDTLLCEGRPSRLRFCIDRFEYPNLEGTKPAVLASFRDAKKACGAEGKRLCYADEWALSCEGPRTLPYPYGLERDSMRCRIDQPSPIPDKTALRQPQDVSLEMQRLDRRAPSGSQPKCESPFQVFDTVGNVGEWVVDRQGDRLTAIAGGHWGKTRGTCRSLDSRFNASHRSHQVGFRCCRRTRDGRTTRQLLPEGARLPKRRRILP